MIRKLPTIADRIDDARERSSAICGAVISKRPGEEAWADELAVAAGVSANRLHSYASAGKPDAPRLDRLLVLLDLAPEFARRRALEEIAGQFGFALVPMASHEDAGIDDVLESLLNASERAGRVCRVVREGRAADSESGSEIGAGEAQHLVEVSSELASAAVEVMARAGGLKRVVVGG